MVNRNHAAVHDEQKRFGDVRRPGTYFDNNNDAPTAGLFPVTRLRIDWLRPPPARGLGATGCRRQNGSHAFTAPPTPSSGAGRLSLIRQASAASLTPARGQNAPGDAPVTPAAR